MQNRTDPSPCFRASDSFVSRRIGDEILLVPIRQHGAELHNIVRLNDVAAFIWERLDGSTSCTALTMAIVGHYLVDEAEAAADLAALLDQLRAIDAIEAV